LQKGRPGQTPDPRPEALEPQEVEKTFARSYALRIHDGEHEGDVQTLRGSGSIIFRNLIYNMARAEQVIRLKILCRMTPQSI
jgi:hypothetical protein